MKPAQLPGRSETGSARSGSLRRWLATERRHGDRASDSQRRVVRGGLLPAAAAGLSSLPVCRSELLAAGWLAGERWTSPLSDTGFAAMPACSARLLAPLCPSPSSITHTPAEISTSARSRAGQGGRESAGARTQSHGRVLASDSGSRARPAMAAEPRRSVRGRGPHGRQPASLRTCNYSTHTPAAVAGTHSPSSPVCLSGALLRGRGKLCKARDGLAY